MQYKELFKINLFHEFYQDGTPDFAQLSPDENTNQWFRQNGIIFRMQGNVGYVMAPNAFNLQEVTSQNPTLELTFLFTSQNQYFMNFTDYPIDKTGKKVFTNVASDKQENGQYLLKESFKPSSNLRDGVASMQIQLDQLVKDASSSGVDYWVQFKSRATIWKYYIIDQTDTSKKLKLGGEGANLFGSASQEVLPTGAKAQVFDSGENPIAIKERGPLHLNLMQEVNAGKFETLIRELPNASPELLSQTIVNGVSKACSNIYLYI